VASQIERLNRTDGDIDTLTARIDYVRTWNYIAQRSGWTRDPAHWQGVARGIEDRLSDALHERLTQRFVDRRAAVLVKSLKNPGALLSSVGADGGVAVEGHYFGRTRRRKIQTTGAPRARWSMPRGARSAVKSRNEWRT
jgi:ATP-dependent RNA helicase SUPV3L1/SUV3